MRSKIVPIFRLTSLFLIAFTLDAGAASLIKGPYLIYPFNNTGMKVLWQTDETPVNTSMQWWETPAESFSSGSLGGSGSGANEHQFGYTITDLTPATRYYYRVAVDSEEATGSFLTAPSDASAAVTLYGYGDSRQQPSIHDSVVRQLLADVAADPMGKQTIALHTGDLVDDGNFEDEWDAHYFNRSYLNVLEFMSRMALLPCWGNHEGNGELLQKYFPYSDQNKDGYYYSFDYGPAHVTVVDQRVGFFPGSIQYNWLEDDLAGTQKLWKLVVLHVPAYSSGGRHTNDQATQAYLSPLFEQHAVAIVMSGHNHYYARCDVNGVQYITSGGGGVELDDPGSDYPFVAIAEKTHHFIRYEIFNNQMIVTAVRDDGSVIERFAIRNDNGSVSAFLKGDADSDGDVSLRDAILAMQLIGGSNQGIIYVAADVNEDNKIGMAEAIYIMQTVAGLR